MITAIVSTIGCEFALEALDSLPRLDEALVVVDMVGRASSELEGRYPLARFEADVAARGARLVRYEAAPGTWAVHNGSYNAGIREARNDWVVITHDDAVWPAFDFGGALRKTISWIDAKRTTPEGSPIVGVILREWEAQHEVMVPSFELDRPALCQCVAPVSQVIKKEWVAAIGGFDEEYGVWYDGQLEHESLLRGWWYVYLPTPPLVHQSNRTYRENNWGNSWAANPKWGRHPENFQRKYGVPPADRHLLEVDDRPLGLML